MKAEIAASVVVLCYAFVAAFVVIPAVIVVDASVTAMRHYGCFVWF